MKRSDKPTHATVDTGKIEYVQAVRASNYFKYDNGYVSVGSLEPGFGYWVKFSQAGSLLLIAEAQAGQTGGEDELATYDKFTVTDASGKQQDLYVRNGERPSNFDDQYWEMPPPPPNESFDVRLETDMFVKTAYPATEPLDLTFLMTGVEFPVTLSWQINPENGITYSLPDSSGGLGKGSTISSIGSLTLSSGSKKIRLQAWASSSEKNVGLPTEYKLQQNYPNPFNPETRINFEVPQDDPVRLVVCDVLGREVATIVNEFKKAGRYDVMFSATHLASGVYFYRLQAGKFVAVKKLLVLR